MMGIVEVKVFRVLIGSCVSRLLQFEHMWYYIVFYFYVLTYCIEPCLCCVIGSCATCTIAHFSTMHIASTARYRLCCAQLVGGWLKVERLPKSPIARALSMSDDQRWLYDSLSIPLEACQIHLQTCFFLPLLHHLELLQVFLPQHLKSLALIFR